MQGIGKNGLNDNCKAEFDYAILQRGVAGIIPVVMDGECRNQATWKGNVGFRLGQQLYTDLSEGSTPTAAKLDELAKTIKSRLKARKRLGSKRNLNSSKHLESPSSPPGGSSPSANQVDETV